MNTMQTEMYYYGVDGEGIRGPAPLSNIAADITAGVLSGAVGVSRGMYGPWVPLREVQQRMAAPGKRLAQSPNQKRLPTQEKFVEEASDRGYSGRLFSVAGFIDALGWLALIFGALSIGIATFFALWKDPGCVPWFYYAVFSLASGLSLLVVSVALDRLTRIATAVEKLASKAPTP